MKLLVFCASFLVTAVTGLHAPLHSKVHLKDFTPSQLNGRIILGEPAQWGQFPWHTVVLGTNPDGGMFFGGGSLISDLWVLTAAHCVRGAVSFELRFGSTNMHEPVVSRYSRYSEHHPNHDIGVIRLDEAVPLGGTIWPIALPHRGQTDRFENVIARVQGHGGVFGGGASDTLNFVDLRVISNDECASHYGSVAYEVVCAVGYVDYRHSGCGGDSGGALAYNYDGAWRQIGIVAFGSAEGCEHGAPSGFTRVTPFLDWIVERTGIDIP